MAEITESGLVEVFDRVQALVHKTPVLTSRLLDEMAGSTLFFKCENFQRMGAFKMRGATNAVQRLSKEQLKKGVLTHSSGNFAQALSLAAKQAGAKAYIVMPDSAPMVKRSAVRSYGGEIILCESTIEARERKCRQIEIETGATFIHPSDNLDVIYGNATATIELLQEQPDLEIVITPVGGGGLIAGTALAVHFFGKSCITIGAEPAIADDAYRSFISGKIETNVNVNGNQTVADGLRTNLGKHNFPIIRKYVNQIIRVEEAEILSALRLIYERLKIVVEPSSAVALAAVLNSPQVFKGKKTGVILSGGNIDLREILKRF